MINAQIQPKYKNLIIVYGTLLSGESNFQWYLKGKGQFLDKFETEPKFKMLTTGGFPIVTDGDTSIKGEIFSVDDDTLRAIYRLEGYSGVRGHQNNWYDTVLIETPYGEAEMFYQSSEELDDSRLQTIESGDWLKRNE